LLGIAITVIYFIIRKNKALKHDIRAKDAEIEQINHAIVSYEELQGKIVEIKRRYNDLSKALAKATTANAVSDELNSMFNG
jgi:hypothetical protein